ncbi:hypothetical protein [Chamaesiphon sp. OTE_8_metabat_110]|nr:hypothetical protein [Chamaesiphon sp. OTE_8_metabat_110]
MGSSQNPTSSQWADRSFFASAAESKTFLTLSILPRQLTKKLPKKYPEVIYHCQRHRSAVADNFG